MAVHDTSRVPASADNSVYHTAMRELVDTLAVRLSNYTDVGKVPAVYSALLELVATSDVYGIRTLDAAIAINERLMSDEAVFILFEEIMIEWGVRLDSLGLRAPIVALVARSLSLTAPESESSTPTSYRAARRVVGHEKWLVSLWIPLMFFMRNNLAVLQQSFEVRK